MSLQSLHFLYVVGALGAAVIAGMYAVAAKDVPAWLRLGVGFMAVGYFLLALWVAYGF